MLIEARTLPVGHVNRGKNFAEVVGHVNRGKNLGHVNRGKNFAGRSC